MALEDHAVELRSRTMTPLPSAEWEELGMRVESSARASAFRRPSSTGNLTSLSSLSTMTPTNPRQATRPVPVPSAERGLLRRMSSTFSAAGAVSLGVQEWPTDWRTDWATRRTFAPSSPESVSSVSSVASSAPATAPVWPQAKTQNPMPVPMPNARRDSLHSQEQECVMDMVCLI